MSRCTEIADGVHARKRGRPRLLNRGPTPWKRSRKTAVASGTAERRDLAFRKAPAAAFSEERRSRNVRRVDACSVVPRGLLSNNNEATCSQKPMHKAGSNPLPIANEHFVQLYRSDAELTDTVATYAADVLDYERQGILFFATRRHCEGFRRALMLHGLDVGGAIARGQIRFITVEKVIPRILREGTIDAGHFETLVTAEFDRMRRSGIRHLHVYGEIVDTLWRNGDRAATIQLEGLWNRLQQHEPFTLYCAYLVDQAPMDAITGALSEAICTHNAILQEFPVDGIRQRRVFMDVPRLVRTVSPALPLTQPIGPVAPPRLAP
jgi:hypothetical protein